MTVVFADIVIVIVIMHARMIQSDAVISCCGDASKAKQSNRYLIRVRAFCSFFFSFFFYFIILYFSFVSVLHQKLNQFINSANVFVCIATTKLKKKTMHREFIKNTAVHSRKD